MKRLILLLALIPILSHAETISADSVAGSVTNSVADSIQAVATKVNFLDRASRSRLFKATYLGVPLIIGGLIEKHQDTKFRKLRNDFMPAFRRHVDDFTQLAPAAAIAGMKAAGVPSRSPWGRMILSDAFAAAIMAGTVQSLKSTTHVVRPDGSNDKSFPSGHTATAFMTATMLNKEYGHLSPWVGIGAYTCATGTGLMRMANNKHWLSDVMVGAGIGIISTETGYWLADIICGKHGLLHNETNSHEIALSTGRPSFLGLYMGFNLPLSHYDLSEDKAFETSTGTTLGIEGAWFFTPYIGIGGRMAISNEQYIINDDEAPDNTFNYYSFHIGPYFSLPLTPLWSVCSKLLLGSVYYPAQTIAGEELIKNQGLSIGTGLSVSYQVKEHLSGSVFLDYNIQAPQSMYSKEYMHTMTLGAHLAVTF